MSEQVKIEYNILVQWDEEASVWIATSDEIDGLILESEQLDALLAKVTNAVPELLDLNKQVPASKLTVNIESRQLECV